MVFTFKRIWNIYLEGKYYYYIFNENTKKSLPPIFPLDPTNL